MARKPKDDPNPLMGLKVSIAHAAEALGVSHVWLRKLAKQGFGPQPIDGKVDISEVFQGYARFHKDEERRHSRTEEARAVQRARAREIELRIAKEEGHLCEMDDVEREFVWILGAFRSELIGVPAASTRDLSTRDKIEEQIEAAVARARERFQKSAAKLRAGKKGNRT